MSKISQFELGPLETCSYLICNGSQAVAIDVGGNPAPMLAALKRDSLALTHILLTHLHFDHTGGVAALVAGCAQAGHTPAVLLHEADLYLLNGGMGMPPVEPFAHSTVPLGTQNFAGLECRVLHTPGHTPGGVAYYFPALDSVFAGDDIFYRSIGRTDFPGGDTNTLYTSIRTQIYTLPDVTAIYPGHGPATCVKDEKCSNPFVRS